MLEGFFSESILGRAQESGAIRVRCTDIRDYTRNKHRRVDDTPYGGRYGMVLACQPVVDCLRCGEKPPDGQRAYRLPFAAGRLVQS